SRTSLVEGGRWNNFNADRDEATALLAVVSRVVAVQADHLRATISAAKEAGWGDAWSSDTDPDLPIS
ncbi:hypothetical protein, partial [Bacillus sp. SIMBA_033]|uniref:hypothetical protein n=1 Tax=Bacillus sp. SIMBA_033 TaxID=3085776 RepID=UPI00397B0F1D